MHLKQKQRGMTFIGLIITAIVVVFVGLVVVQAVPTYMEYKMIQKAVQKASGGETVAEVRSIFDKATTIDQISSITGKDLVIGKQNNRVVVSFAYERDIHLFGPAYLVMRYKGESK
jgi:Tfp pilus assembly major pilin PilA